MPYSATAMNSSVTLSLKSSFYVESQGLVLLLSTYHKKLHTFTGNSEKALVKQSLHVRVSNAKPINGLPKTHC